MSMDADVIARSVSRPWGTYTVLEETSRYKVKRIVVQQGASLSLQSHTKRSEHWVVVEGLAQVLNGDETFILERNNTIFIPKQNRHRVSNIGDTPLVIIEIQVGEYFGEDDITRYEDDYGRC